MKRTILITLILALFLSLLFGCGQQIITEQPTEQIVELTPEPTPTSESTSTSEPTPENYTGTDFEYKDNGDGTCKITNTKYKGSQYVNIPKKINGLSVTSIGDEAFSGCRYLISVIIPDSVTSIGDWAFLNCRWLKDITIPDSVTSIGKKAFSSCDLTSITIPKSVTTIGEEAFSGCSLTSVTIHESVINIEGAFSFCSDLTSIEVSEQNKYFSSIDGILFNKDKSVLIKAPEGIQKENYMIPNGTVIIGDKALIRCDALKGNLIIPNSVTTIGEWAFAYCYDLTDITIPNSVTMIGEWAFGHCYGLTSITIPKSVTAIGNNAFDGSNRLARVEFSGDAPIVFGENVFDNCGRDLSNPARNYLPPGDFKIIYDPAKSGWSTPKWNGYPCYPKTN